MDRTGFLSLPLESRNATTPRAVCSRENGESGGKGTLTQEFEVPADKSYLCFAASAVRASGLKADARLDVLLLDSAGHVIPKLVREKFEWQRVESLLPPRDGFSREYHWKIGTLAGKKVRIEIRDLDDRPGCFIHCTGFQLQTAGEFELPEFGRHMAALSQAHQLFAVSRHDSKNFVSIGNTDDRYTEARLRECETMYALFFDHFRKKGFSLQEPRSKLMVAMFDSQAGFAAYMGTKMPPSITGIYHIPSNRFVVYDFGRNEALLAQKQKAERNGQKIGLQMDRVRYLDTVQRVAEDARTDTNISTNMHEVAHQLSFNSTMLNPEGDLPVWLSEGLACYCEATANGAWQGIGELNPPRAGTLRDVLRSHGNFFAIRDLTVDDRWIRDRGHTQRILTGYAQCWALFRMLMAEDPAAMIMFMQATNLERTPERRLSTFMSAFGKDLAALETRHKAYIQRVVQELK